MGYSTRYTITAVRGDLAKFREAFMKSRHAVEQGYHWFGIMNESDAFKWYEHEAHIIEAMLKSGVDEVDLHGEGEEQGDVWDKEFRRELRPGSKPTVNVKKYRYRMVREETPQ